MNEQPQDGERQDGERQDGERMKGEHMEGVHVRVRRTEVLDEVVRGDEAVVLVQGQILRVSALAHSVRELTGDWVELPDLAQALAARHGEPEGDPLDILHTVVADLESAGLVQTQP